MKTALTFKQALKSAAGGNKSDSVIDAIYDSVEPLCKTETNPESGDGTYLRDWLESGVYYLSDTPKSIAEEWDSLGR